MAVAALGTIPDPFHKTDHLPRPRSGRGLVAGPVDDLRARRSIRRRRGVGRRTGRCARPRSGRCAVGLTPSATRPTPASSRAVGSPSRRGGAIPTSGIPSSRSSASPGSRPSRTAPGCTTRSAGAGGCRPRPSGSTRAALVPGGGLTRGPRPLRPARLGRRRRERLRADGRRHLGPRVVPRLVHARSPAGGPPLRSARSRDGREARASRRLLAQPGARRVLAGRPRSRPPARRTAASASCARCPERRGRHPGGVTLCRSQCAGQVARRRVGSARA